MLKSRAYQEVSVGGVDIKKIVLTIVLTSIITLSGTLLVVYSNPKLFSATSISGNNNLKVVRFSESEEQNITSPSRGTSEPLWVDLETFNWNPENPTKNAIIEVLCEFEYRYESEVAPWPWVFPFKIYANEICILDGSIEDIGLDDCNRWNKVSWKGNSSKIWAFQNQQEHKIVFEIGNYLLINPTYIRNLSIILLVTDGA